MVGSFALALWFICAVVVGQIARALGRSGMAWTLFSMLCSPSLGLIIVAVLDKKERVPGPLTRTKFLRCAAWVKYVMPSTRPVPADCPQV
jgi:hypothetical protein